MKFKVRVNCKKEFLILQKLFEKMNIGITMVDDSSFPEKDVLYFADKLYGLDLTPVLGIFPTNEARANIDDSANNMFSQIFSIISSRIPVVEISKIEEYKHYKEMHMLVIPMEFIDKVEDKLDYPKEEFELFVRMQ